ncbi:MAG: hypothetical protein ACTSV5_03855 [Promethearchaeota archaeon]
MKYSFSSDREYDSRIVEEVTCMHIRIGIRRKIPNFFGGVGPVFGDLGNFLFTQKDNSRDL